MAQRKVNCEVYTDRGIVGKNGADGKSAYQQAVEGGYQGTEEEFEQALASDISVVADNVTNINAVGNNIENVNTVAGNATNINTVATNISSINTAATNMPAIIAAPTEAANAANSATDASASATIATTQAELAKGYADSIDLSNYRTSADQDIIDATLATKAELAGYLPLASKAVANGVASLDANAKVPSAQIPTATTSTLGGVKPDGTTITVTEDGTISVPVSSEVATKAELQDKVSKAGDTMTGDLNLNAGLIFGNYRDTRARIVLAGVGGKNYQILNNSSESGAFLQFYDEQAKGLVLIKSQGSRPYYFDGTNSYRLLTTADLANIDYVVESQVNADGSWYRKYKSGWLEQGNSSPTGDPNFTLNKTINFPKPFADNTYMLVGPGFFIANIGAQNITRTTTGFTTNSVQNMTGCEYWYACGQGA